MARYVKRTNNYHRQLTSKKESRRKSQPLKAKELKSIMIEFRTSEQRDIFSPFMFKVLPKNGMDKCFTKYSKEGNTICFSTKSKKYVGEDYMSLAVEIATNINKYEFYETMLSGEDEAIYSYIKLYTRKGRQHIYIGIDIESKLYMQLPGKGECIGIREREECSDESGDQKSYYYSNYGGYCGYGSYGGDDYEW